MTATKSRNGFLKGFGSALAIFPSRNHSRPRFLYRGQDVQYRTSHQAIQEIWESVGSALHSAMSHVDLSQTEDIADAGK